MNRDDFDEDHEWVDDDADDSADDLLVCPNCRADVHEDTQQCPHCGEWITPVYPSEHRWSRVWIVAVILLLLAFVLPLAL